MAAFRVLTTIGCAVSFRGTKDQLPRRRLREGLRARRRCFPVMENKRSQGDPPDVHSTTTAGPQKTEQQYRLAWCRSSQMAEHDAQVRGALLGRAEAESFDLATRANTRALRHRRSILQGAKPMLRRLQCQSFFELNVRCETRIDTLRLPRRRPGKNDPDEKIRSRIFRLQCRRPEASYPG